MSAGFYNSYKDEMNRALEKFQFIEEVLKKSLLSAIEINRLQESPHLPIKYNEKRINNLPLGPLINEFTKINNDTDLLNDLREIKKERNDVAHQSLSFTMGELQNESYMLKATAKMKDTADRATIIHERVLEVRYKLIEKLNKVKRLKKKNSAMNDTTNQTNKRRPG